MLFNEKFKMIFITGLMVFVLLGMGFFILGEEVVSAEQRTLRIEADAWIIEKFPIRQAAERFEEDHPDVEVTVEPKDYEDFVRTYLLMWNYGDTTVDLGIGGMPMQLAPLVGADHLVDLSDMFEGDMAEERFVNPLLESAKFVDDEGNDIYPTLPFMGEVMTLNINTTFFDEVDQLDDDGSPIHVEDFDELYNLIVSLDEVAPGPGFSADWGWNFINYTYASGLLAKKGDILEEDGQKLDLSSNEAIEWLEFNQRLVEEGYASDGTITDVNYGRDNYNAGIIPMIYTAHSRFIEGAADLGEGNVSMLPLPGSLEHGTIVFTHAVFVPEVSPNQDLARKFIEEQVFSEWFQQWSYNRYGKLPMIEEFYEGLEWFQNEALQMLEMAEEGEYFPKYRDGEELIDLFQEELHPMLQGEQTPEEALNRLRNLIEERGISLERLDQ